MEWRRLARGNWWLLVMGLLGGCAHPQPDVRILWPLPPEQPRIEHLGNYQSTDDLPKDRLKKWLDANLGIVADPVFAEPGGIHAHGDQVYISGRTFRFFPAQGDHTVGRDRVRVAPWPGR